MPDKSFTVATYAAGASLAAITLIYVFAPTYFLDSDHSGTSAGGLLGSRKKTVVGLANPANDCFINSVLQALAGLGDLRLYLIRETHRRSLDDACVYSRPVPPDAEQQTDGEGKDAAGRKKAKVPDWKLEGLQSGVVTRGLKEILDALNERPIYRKTITAAPFVRALEQAFRQRISRQQQDAQEFLQVVAERLCDEYHAGHRARRFARRKAALAASQGAAENPLDGDLVQERLAELANDTAEETRSSEGSSAEDALPAPSQASSSSSRPRGVTVDGDQKGDGDGEGEGAGAGAGQGQGQGQGQGGKEGRQEEQEEEGGEEEEGFPMEGKFESQIECLTCGFKPKPSASTFCTLTLNVPQVPATTLNDCFDGMLKTEYIDGFKCEKCRLLHAVSLLEAELRKPGMADEARQAAQEAIAKLEAAIQTDPEKPPADVTLPDLRLAPKRRIARHMRVTSFPKILAIHLSRSIFDASQLSQKNSAKVAFPERLPLGGLLSQRRYKLLGLVTHKGSHHSGHYESFRRQNIYPPFSNTNTFRIAGVYSKTASPASTPTPAPVQQQRPEKGSPTPGSPLASTASSSLRSVDRASSSHTRPLSLRSITNNSNSNSNSNRPSSSTSGSARHSGKDNGETSSLASVAASARSTLSRITSRPSSSSRSAKTSTTNVEPNGAASSRISVDVRATVPPTQTPRLSDGGGTTRPSTATTILTATTTTTTTTTTKTKTGIAQVGSRRRRLHDRWWRISDDKIKEASTRDVLGMQREVYLLFYELDREEAE